ncbi:uncharacterized protein SOCG_03661 [Schizosaccharomyces octosporus yFS286]|uniref:Fungal protein n=1 Tax=Schizosaccharomyces octosporus (strain yFS286) TaxID=483514 RepID=S9QZP4_SCHOY|nr:uncharacterized protein SOCG_03661 [Schizosaccharomyces octosporus yFS286]EPX71725.1 fungal protein [Schizosaccharomyces octosporus yFS286]
MNIFIPKTRRPTFEVHLKIQDLSNIPLVTGLAFIKWNLDGVHTRESSGQTKWEPVLEHKVVWVYDTTIAVRFVIDQTNTLRERFLNFQIYSDSHSSSGIVRLGSLKINLAEYVGVGMDSRKYLLSDSKINATLRIGIGLKQLSGANDFHVTKKLGKPQVFSGLTGLLTEGKELKRRDDEAAIAPGLASNWAEKMLTSIKDFNQKASTFHMHTKNNKYDTKQIVDDIFFGGSGWAERPVLSDIPDGTTDPRLVALEIRQRSWILPSEKEQGKPFF